MNIPLEETKIEMNVSGYDRKKEKTMRLYRTMTLQEIMSLSYGKHVLFLANDGTIRELKINGKIRTWKRDSSRVEIPVKYGMYEYAVFNLQEAKDKFRVLVSED